mmetsp:Transcript_52662/g.132360  ORF Transcript_52662/g.132360 Transcript_52662/m.132360 type:complete len:216 (+) Transcript_52662:1522-2169(+)
MHALSVFAHNVSEGSAEDLIEVLKMCGLVSLLKVCEPLHAEGDDDGRDVGANDVQKNGQETQPQLIAPLLASRRVPVANYIWMQSDGEVPGWMPKAVDVCGSNRCEGHIHERGDLCRGRQDPDESQAMGGVDKCLAEPVQPGLLSPPHHLVGIEAFPLLAIKHESLKDEVHQRDSQDKYDGDREDVHELCGEGVHAVAIHTEDGRVQHQQSWEAE